MSPSSLDGIGPRSLEEEDSSLNLLGSLMEVTVNGRRKKKSVLPSQNPHTNNNKTSKELKTRAVPCLKTKNRWK